MAFPAIIAAVASLFEPATKILENLHISEADKLKLQNELAKIQADTQAKFIQLEQDKLDLQKVEANSTNWCQANWRPICSMAIVVIIICASFGIIHPDQKFWSLAEYFLLGYTGGRSLEKVAPGVIDAVGKLIKK